MTEDFSEQEVTLSEEEKQKMLQVTKELREQRLLHNQEVQAAAEVSPEEYLRRLELARKRDYNSLNNIKGKRAAKASKEWAELVGSTFAQAETNLPMIRERIHRLETRTGLHKTSVILYGDKLGRGKTWNAYGYLNALVGEGVLLPGQIFFGTESSTISHIANSGFNRNTEMSSMKRQAHKVFYIDDVGQGYFFKEEQRHEVWYELIDHIYTKRLTLIMTTNKLLGDAGPGGLARWVGPRAFDRLRTLVGSDGAILLSGENKRDWVHNENEKQYRRQ